MSQSVTGEFWASAAVGTTAAGTGVDLRRYREIAVILRVTAVSGTSPTLDLKYQVSYDGTNYTDIGTSHTQATGATIEYKYLTLFGSYVRAYATIGGTNTPLVTFSVGFIAKE